MRSGSAGRRGARSASRRRRARHRPRPRPLSGGAPAPRVAGGGLEFSRRAESALRRRHRDGGRIDRGRLGRRRVAGEARPPGSRGAEGRRCGVLSARRPAICGASWASSASASCSALARFVPIKNMTLLLSAMARVALADSLGASGAGGRGAGAGQPRGTCRAARHRRSA